MREKEKNTRVIYVRHGKTDFPEDRIYCDDREDPQLNATGINQVEGLKKFFQENEIDAVYVSPIKRTLMTAEEIVSVTKAPLIKSDNLKERNFGILQGLFFSEIKENYSLEFKKWKENPAEFKPKGGESIFDLHKRVKEIVKEAVSKYIGKTIVIVSHVGPIRMAITDAFQMPLKSYRQISIDFASLTRIDYGKSQNNFIYLNNLPYSNTLK